MLFYFLFVRSIICCENKVANPNLPEFIFCFHYRGLRATTISAVMAATRRSMQLGGIPEKDIVNKYNL